MTRRKTPGKSRPPVVRFLIAQLPNWDLFLTVAFVFVAVTRPEQSAPPSSDVDEMLDMVTEQFQEWKPYAVDAFEDCKKFYDRNFRAMSNDPDGRGHPFLSADILGLWTVQNLFRKMP